MATGGPSGSLWRSVRLGKEQRRDARVYLRLGGCALAVAIMFIGLAATSSATDVVGQGAGSHPKGLVDVEHTTARSVDGIRSHSRMCRPTTTSYCVGVGFNFLSNTPMITITGVNTVGSSGFGNEPYPVAPSGCGDVTGFDQQSNDLYFVDTTAGWGAGRLVPGDCTGLVMEEYSPTKIAFVFGNYYGAANSETLTSGDAFLVSVYGTICSGTVPTTGTVSCILQP